MSKTTTQFQSGRHAGILLPLFSAPRRQSWGIGDVADLPAICSWLREAGCDFLLMLPVNEMSSGQHSPYSAVSAMAIDPIYVSIPDVDEFGAFGGEDALSSEDRAALAAARGAPRVDYVTVRRLKMEALRRAFERFHDLEWRRETTRARRFHEYVERERWWLEDYVLYRALREHHDEQPWWKWEPGLASREAHALTVAREAHARECLFFAYVQWLAGRQWEDARRKAAPVGLFGDLPFMVGADSADVWANQHAFRLDASVGTPPDAFSETGQNWGLPVYRWEVFEAERDTWIRARAQRGAELYDAYRVDHLVGFYRTYVIPHDGGERAFSPEDEDAQLAQGERLMRAFAESGARIVAEDLGTVPDFVRESLLRLDIPGYKVLRWEREWDDSDQPFRDPLAYPKVSLATSGTHDTETLVEWWEGATVEERRLVAEIPFLADKPINPETTRFDSDARDALIEVLFASSSDFVVIPMQDLFGWRDRVNTPATVSDENWTWRLPWPIDTFGELPETQERAHTLRGWARAYKRSVAMLGGRARRARA